MTNGGVVFNENVNMCFGPPKGWEEIFPTYPLFGVMTLAIAALDSVSSATTRERMSRSVTMPVMRPSSRTMRAETRCSSMVLAALRIELA